MQEKIGGNSEHAFTVGTSGNMDSATIHFGSGASYHATSNNCLFVDKSLGKTTFVVLSLRMVLSFMLQAREIFRHFHYWPLRVKNYTQELF